MVIIINIIVGPEFKKHLIKDSYNIQHYIKLMKYNIVKKIRRNRWRLIDIIVDREVKKYLIRFI